ncbi:uncharacterized protein VICG_00871 [Vittaforma corneae ATCC 50505]|uniref:Glutaredoxin domain-containing protein n=1 Tax=Vittaforma corneae (strain ATCC 50505) TaxID=993615 RepID=L2GN26_VITCO|nr:uncharacterized protein VICG_00871 [Vittaforma corneae ATCC 50505]ELA42024.1 hypothetical protein VICG_00871 [Vittaforma corneae ATCC 50505]
MKLKEVLQKNPTIVVTKENCPFCDTAKNTLDKKKVKYLEIDGMKNQDLVQEIVQKEKHKTFPMIYLNGKFIGGNDKLQEYYRDLESNKENLNENAL